MRHRRRQDNRLYWWKIAAGVASTAYLTGLLLTALLHERGSGPYAAVVIALLAAVLLAMAVSVLRRFRAWLRRPPRPGGPLEDAAASVAGAVGTAAAGIALVRGTRKENRP